MECWLAFCSRKEAESNLAYSEDKKNALWKMFLVTFVGRWENIITILFLNRIYSFYQSWQQTYLKKYALSNHKYPKGKSLTQKIDIKSTF